MSTESYEDWAASKECPSFQRAHRPRSADIVELPEVLVTEGDAAEDTIRRHMTKQRLAWTQRKFR